MTQQMISPQRIRTDLDTQSRAGLNEQTVTEYAEAMEAGQVFPPILVFQDETIDEYILADGFHRLAAHLQISPDEPILAEVRSGTAEDARWESIGANKSHGLRRTNEDKRNATTLALMHPNGADMSNIKIAEHVGVSHTTVQNIRKELEATCKICKSETRTCQDGRVIHTENIGTKKSPPPEGAICNDCRHFQNGVCQVTGDDPFPWHEACDDFDEAEKESDDEAEEPPEKPERKHRGPSIHQYRRLKDCQTCHLPDDNPQLFAVELRNSFKEKYLRDCMQALEHLLNDNDE